MMASNFLPKNVRDECKYLDNAIIIGYRGSIAHCMYVPQSDPTSIDDKDIMSVILPDIYHYFGLESFGSRGTKENFIGEWDLVSYEFLKFISLLKKCNPNVMSLLWIEKCHYIHRKPEGKYLIENRDMFSSKQAYHSFVGYAYGQLKRMEAFTKRGYMGEKRKRLVDKFGYDTKNAAHLIRLLRMGIEFLNEGVLYVKRKDNQNLLSIKRGEWTLEQVKKESDLLFKRIEGAYDRCKLPNNIDSGKVNSLCYDILGSRFFNKNP